MHHHALWFAIRTSQPAPPTPHMRVARTPRRAASWSSVRERLLPRAAQLRD
jgi:hypothetical protein